MMDDYKENYLLLAEENKLLKSQIYILEKAYKNLTIKCRDLETNYNNDQKIFLEIQCERLNEKCTFLNYINNKLINKNKAFNSALAQKANMNSLIERLKNNFCRIDKKAIVDRLCKLNNEDKICGNLILEGIDGKEKANIFTDVARAFIKSNPELALKLAEAAWVEDPRGYRLKWWAFRAHDAGYPKLADILLEYVPNSEIKKDTEVRKVKSIKNSAKREYETTYKAQENSYLSNDKIASFYNKELKKQYDELKKNYEILFNEKCQRDYEYAKLEEIKNQWSKHIDHAWDLAKIENLEKAVDKEALSEETDSKVYTKGNSLQPVIDENKKVPVNTLSPLDIIEIVKMHMTMVEKYVATSIKVK